MTAAADAASLNGLRIASLLSLPFGSGQSIERVVNSSRELVRR
jgi:hypothetical protein